MRCVELVCEARHHSRSRGAESSSTDRYRTERSSSPDCWSRCRCRLLGHVGRGFGSWCCRPIGFAAVVCAMRPRRYSHAARACAACFELRESADTRSDRLCAATATPCRLPTSLPSLCAESVGVSIDTAADWACMCGQGRRATAAARPRACGLAWLQHRPPRPALALQLDLTALGHRADRSSPLNEHSARTTAAERIPRRSKLRPCACRHCTERSVATVRSVPCLLCVSAAHQHRVRVQSPG